MRRACQSGGRFSHDLDVEPSEIEAINPQDINVVEIKFFFLFRLEAGSNLQIEFETNYLRSKPTSSCDDFALFKLKSAHSR